MPGAELAACTIISKNYLSYARVLADSFRRYHPAGRMFVLLVDRLDGYFSPDQEPFELVELTDLDIPDLPRFCFQYTILELNTAAKPYFLRHLLRDRGVAKLLYLDPDIQVFREMAPLRDLLEHSSLLLTPHLSEALPDDGRKPSEKDIMEAGAFNLGFLGLRADETVARFLDWWAARLYDKCIVAPAAGFFVDQRWTDLVPGLFDGVHVVRDPGYNVAYWNLPHRRLEGAGDDLRVNGKPLYFFHFSGVEFERLELISKHQDRLTLDDRPDLLPLFQEYRASHLRTGWEESSRWPYAFATFDNGVTIPPLVRRVYLRMGDDVRRFGNPFSTGRPESFWRWLTGWASQEVEPGTGITRLWYEVYLSRPDVQRALPDVFGTHRAAFLDWIRQSGRSQFEFPAELAPREAGEPGRGTHPEEALVDWTRGGINVVGYARSEKGVGEALRATVRALRAAGIPHAVVDFPDPTSANTDTTLADVITEHAPYPVNLIHVNADALPYFVSRRGTEFLRGKYNIGFWMWELPELPPAYHGGFAHLDEVWVGSNYCLETISRVSPIPVVKVPLALPAEGLETKGLDRRHFGLPDGPLLYLFIFDVQSILSRKNPTGLIDAFKRAFPKGEDVRLVLKLVHGDEKVRRALLDHAQDPRVVLIDRVLDRPELNSLIDVCDCYVSLHRSEGFGVTMAEAMALGKPVIATAYSANVDFMNAGNSFPIRYDLVRLEQDHGPYPRGSTWAEPDVEHAAELIRLVYEAPERARQVALRGQREIWQYLAPAASGERIRQRLAVIRESASARPASRTAAAVPTGAAGVPGLPAVPEPTATSARPVVGPAIGFVKRLVGRAIRWYVDPQVAAIRTALAAVHEYLVNVSRDHQRRLQRVESELPALREQMSSLDGRVAQFRGRVAQLDGRVNHLHGRLDQLPGQLGTLESRLSRIERQMFQPPYTNPEFPTHGGARARGTFDYAGFQQKFRGPSRFIRSLLGFYTPLFANRRAVVDLGCGRGEFLEALREHAVPARGVDIDADQVAECRQKGLDVAAADMLEYLASLADGALDGVFSAQVLEHLPFPKVTSLFEACYQKLGSGGILVAETVNPHCLPALKLFHLDPTHVAPLFPETLQFLAESIGFKNVRIVYPPREGLSDPYYESGEYAVVAER